MTEDEILAISQNKWDFTKVSCCTMENIDELWDLIEKKNGFSSGIRQRIPETMEENKKIRLSREIFAAKPAKEKKCC